MPPYFEFNPLTMAHIDAIKLFSLLSVLLIFLADVCRQTIAVLRISASEPTPVLRGTDPTELSIGYNRFIRIADILAAAGGTRAAGRDGTDRRAPRRRYAERAAGRVKDQTRVNLSR